MNTHHSAQKQSENLILDELFDLTLYRRLRAFARPEMHMVLDTLIAVEMRHLAFWQQFFNNNLQMLGIGRKIKLTVIVLFCRALGTSAMHLTLEAIEIHGIRKYLELWDMDRDPSMREGLRRIIEDELQHEDIIVSSAANQKINPERVRDIFLGLNDGLVEMLGAVSGFFAVFQTISSVLGAGMMVAIAGSISMAAGAYVAFGSEQEVEQTALRKKQFLYGTSHVVSKKIRPVGSAVVVGVSYFCGTLVPVLPILLGGQNIVPSLIAAALAIIVVSYFVAFLSGMKIRNRISINITIITIVVSISYLFGLVARNHFGINL